MLQYTDSKTVIATLTERIPFLYTTKWLDAGEGIVLQDAVRVGYIIMHEPTGAIYVGSTGAYEKVKGDGPDMVQGVHRCFVKWFGRLKGLDNGSKDLSVAFRAIFTKRSDFTFQAVTKFTNSNAAFKWQETRAKLIAEEFGREKALNIDTRSSETRGFWMRRVPKEEWDMRFGSMVQARKRRALQEERDATKLANERMQVDQEESNDYLRSIIRRHVAPADLQPGVSREDRAAQERQEIEENTRRLLAAFPNAGPHWAKPIASSDPVVFVAPAKVMPPWPEMPRYTQGTKFTSYADEMKRWRDAVLHVALQRGMPEASWPVVSFMPATTCKELSDLGAGLLDQVKAVCPQEEP